MRSFHKPRKIIRTQEKIITTKGAIEYQLCRSSARRTLAISIDDKAKVTVSVPLRVALKDIHRFLNEKSHWINEKVAEARKNLDYLQSRRFDHGNEFLYLGKKYPIVIKSSQNKRLQFNFEDNQWLATIPEDFSEEEREEKIKDKLKRWYRQQAEELIGSRIFHYSRIIGIGPKKIAIRTQKRMWGCCDYNTQTIHINWQIILSPLEVVDYVVVHEICHLLVPNHSKRFWNKVAKVMPRYKHYQAWLKANFLDMTLP
ncbi:MAG: M48 family metallopeptidase [Candidatus Omnitrophica bacterium]|nr:M48 family metallopeptidase [Candidatus Omnitrophota bacterium]